MKILAYLLPFLLVVDAFSEGLPLDEARQKVTAPHSLVSLNSSQLEELEAMGTVTFSDTQWRELRKVSPGTPKRISGVLPITWNDCTCGEAVEGIRMGDGRIAVLHTDLEVKRLLAEWRYRKEVLLRVDARGQFHLDGVRLRYPLLLEVLRKSEPVEGGVAVLKVPVSMSLKDPVFEDRLKVVYTLLAEKGWNGGKMPYWF